MSDIVWPETIEPASGSLSNETIRVCQYTTERPLVRPHHSILHLLLVLSVYVAGSAVSGYLLSILLIDVVKPRILHIVSSCVFLLLGLKYIIICLIQIYQRYAPEHIRRRCKLMPTCSEYCILALKKYGLLRGTRKSLVRLFRTCDGSGYREDWP